MKGTHLPPYEQVFKFEKFFRINWQGAFGKGCSVGELAMEVLAPVCGGHRVLGEQSRTLVPRMGLYCHYFYTHPRCHWVADPAKA